MDTVDETMSTVVYEDVYDDAHNDVDVNTPACVIVDAVHLYDCVPEGLGNFFRTRELDGI